MIRLLIFFLSTTFVLSGQGLLQKIEQEIQSNWENITPSIVQIQGYREENPLPPFAPSDRMVKESGIGFIFNQQGYILTGSFIAKLKNIQVQLFDGQILEAKVHGFDHKTNVGVLKVDPADQALLPAKIAHHVEIKVGSIVFAVGNAYGMGKHLSTGLVSRNFEKMPGENYLALSIPMYPGDRGGYVFNTHGEIIAILDGVAYQEAKTNEKQKPSAVRPWHDLDPAFKEWQNKHKSYRPKSFLAAGSEMTMAIPITDVLWAMETVVLHGKIPRGWLGVKAIDLNGMSNKSTWGGGVLVNQVSPDSPAKKGGISVGDIIISFAGQRLEGIHHFKDLVTQTKGRVPVTVLRGAEQKNLIVDIKQK